MKWILKKLIVVLVEALVVMGLLDALGIDIEGLFGGILGDEDVTDPSAEETTGATEETTGA